MAKLRKEYDEPFIGANLLNYIICKVMARRASNGQNSIDFQVVGLLLSEIKLVSTIYLQIRILTIKK